jgi:hypothetical protein
MEGSRYGAGARIFTNKLRIWMLIREAKKKDGTGPTDPDPEHCRAML